MKDTRLRRHPLVALRDRFRGGQAASGTSAKRNLPAASTAAGVTAARTATLTAPASAAASSLAKAPEAPLYYMPPIRSLAGQCRAGPQLLSDQLYETVHPLLFSSASPSVSGIASSGGDGDSLMLGGGVLLGGAAGRAAAGRGSVASSIANSSISTRPESGESAGERRPNCDCDFCQRVATADFSLDVTAPAAAQTPGPRAPATLAAGSELNRSESIDWYNVSAEIEAAATAAAAASAAPTSAAGAPTVPAGSAHNRGASAAVGDSTREIFGDEVRLTLQSSAAAQSAVATAAAASSTPHQPQTTQPPEQSRAAQLLGESAMPPYSRQLLARLLAEPSPSTTTNTEGGRDSNFLSPASSSPSMGSFAVNSPLLHNSRCSPLAIGGLTDGAPVNPDLAGLDFSSASSFRLVGSAATPTSTSSLLSATPPPPPPPTSAPSTRRPLHRARLPAWGLQRVGPAQSPSSPSSYKSSLVPSSTESSLSGCRPGSLVLTPPPGFGSPTGDVTVVAVASSNAADEDPVRSISGGGGGCGGSALRLRRVRKTGPQQLRRANAFSSRLRWQ